MTSTNKHKRDLCRSGDLSPEDVGHILDLSADLKAKLKKGEPHARLAGKSLAMLFEKPSLRTRSTFELGMVQLGGHAVYLSPDEVGLGKRESVADVARNIERWFDLCVARTFAQSSVDELAGSCGIPVINALSDEEHPCQALADYMTLREHAGDLAGFRLAYVGDGNNICHSLMLIGAKLGVHITVSSPAGYEPDEACVLAMRDDLAESGGSYIFCRDPTEAVSKAQAIYTDVWASMGQEEEAIERAHLFAEYQVNAELVAGAPAGALIMHDLPAHRGEEITDEVIDGPRSIVFDQAENRLHAQKGVMAYLCGTGD